MSSHSIDKKLHAHNQHEQLFLSYYQQFQKKLEDNKAYKRSGECVYKLGMQFLESSCYTENGFPGELHHVDKVDESCKMISTPFDSALLLPFLQEENCKPSILQSLVNTINSHRQPSGFFNYFAPVDNRTFMFPYDIEDTAICMLALFLTGNKTKDECQNNARKMLDLGMKTENGALGIWLPNIDNSTILYEKLLTQTKMDLAGLVNTLCYMAIIGMEDNEDDLSKIMPSINFVADLVNQLVENQGSASGLKGMIYYPNQLTVYLFLSRYVHHSSIATNTFGEKLKILVRGEIRKLNTPWEKGMNIACCILAALYLGLHHEETANPKGLEAGGADEIKTKLHTMYEQLLTRQLKDGSFATAMVFKMTHFGHYGGSPYISTTFAVSAIGRYRRQVLEKMDDKSKSDEN